MLATTTDTDQHGVASGLTKDTADPQDLLNSVIEEDKVELVIGRVVVIMLFVLEELVQLARVCDFFIQRHS